MIPLCPALDAISEGPHPEFDVAVRSTVSLGRNLADRRFPGRMDGRERSEAEAEVRAALGAAGMEVARVGDLDPEARPLFAGRELYTRAYLVDDRAIVALHPGRPSWAAFGDGEHVSFRAALPGLALEAAWALASGADDDASRAAVWAFDGDTGYVMTEAARCGTGLSASVALHLPALVLSGLADAAFRRAMEAGFVVAGAYSAAAPSAGSLFGISLPPAVREAEAVSLRRLSRAAGALAEYERRVRVDLLARGPWDILDVVGRAFGRAACARLVGWDEAAEIVSGLRLGIATGIVRGPGLAPVTDLWYAVRAARRDRGAAPGEPEAAARARALRKAVEGARMDEGYADV